MKYGQFLNALNTLRKLSGSELPIRDAYKVFKLSKELQPISDFLAQREIELIKKYNGTVNEDGSISFLHGDDERARQESDESMKRFLDEINALNDTEIEDEFTPVTLKYDALGDQKMTPSELMAIEGFVYFE